MEMHGAASVQSVIEMVRRISGKGVRRHDVCVFLANKLNWEPVGDILGTTHGNFREPLLEHEKWFPKSKTEPLAKVPGNPSWAPHKVLGLEELDNLSSESKDSSPKLSAAKNSQRFLKMDLRTLPEVVADEVLAVLKAEITPTLRGMTWMQWRMRNRRALVDMASSSMSAEEILNAFRAESEALGETIRSIPFLQQRLNAHDVSPYAQHKARESQERSREDDLPLLIDLVDLGLVEPWTVPIHPVGSA